MYSSFITSRPGIWSSCNFEFVVADRIKPICHNNFNKLIILNLISGLIGSPAKTASAKAEVACLSFFPAAEPSFQAFHFLEMSYPLRERHYLHGVKSLSLQGVEYARVFLTRVLPRYVLRHCIPFITHGSFPESHKSFQQSLGVGFHCKPVKISLGITNIYQNIN